MCDTKESSHHEQIQVQWHKCLRGVSVRSNNVFHRATHHHLEPNFPIRFASNVGDKIVKNCRVYAKRIVDAFSFTVSLSLTNRDKADVELQSSVAKKPTPKTLPRNLSPTGLLLAYYYDCCAAYMRANMHSIIQFGHPQNKTPVHFLLPATFTCHRGVNPHVVSHLRCTHPNHRALHVHPPRLRVFVRNACCNPNGLCLRAPWCRRRTFTAKQMNR